jgi:hypothetical protein
VIHGTLLTAVHEQPAGKLTVTVPEVAAAATDDPVGAIDDVQGTPAWVTVNVCPAIVIVPDRPLPAGFAAML